MYYKTIYVGSDHRGFRLKSSVVDFLKSRGYNVEDVGPFLYDKDDDFPDYAVKVCRKVLKDNSKGILICGSGIGMDRAANKMRGIYAATCWNETSARLAKKDGDINVFCMGSLFVTPQMAKRMVRVWLEQPFEGGRHNRRINKIKEIEKGRKR